MAERIFWVKCPACAGRFTADYTLRFDVAKLICPFCQRQFLPSESPEDPLTGRLMCDVPSLATRASRTEPLASAPRRRLTPSPR